MKKILASGCCIFFIHSFSHVAVGSETVDEQAGEKRSLLRAIAAIVNTEAYRKSPQKRIFYPHLECPQE